MRRVRAGVAAAMLAAMVLWPGAAAAQEGQDAVGRASDLRGTVLVERDGRVQPLAVGASIRRGDRIFVGPDSRAKLRLADGTVIAAGAASEVRIDEFTAEKDVSGLGTILSLLRGIVRATLSGATAPSRFEVRTQAAVASARSTDFVVESRDVATSVVAIAGRVAVSTARPPAEVLLDPGFGTDVIAGSPPAPPAKWGAGRVRSFVARTDLP